MAASRTHDETVSLIDDSLAQPQERHPGLLVLFSARDGAGRVCAFGPRISVGRTPEHHLRLVDPDVSRHHATFLLEGSTPVLLDEGSHNGSHVNGRRVVGRQSLSVGDIVRCGSALLLCVADVRVFADWPLSAHVPPLLGGPDMQRARRMVELVAQQELEVMLEGESGTGKEVVARMIHSVSRRPGPFVAVNCAALPEGLFEAELFGVTKGAYTGADTDRPGLVASAQGGTLFLDEVGELPLALQAKLLRVLELRQSRPLGATRSRQLDFRLVAATNRRLRDAIRCGAFREDLFHRLCGVTVRLPPLRERREDIAVLVQQQLDGATAVQSGRLAVASPVMERLLLYPWPGNVRELQRVLHEARLQARAEGVEQLRAAHLRPELLESTSETGGDELQRIRAALSRCGGNVRQAASELGLRRQRIYELLHRHGVKPADFRRGKAPG